MAGRESANSIFFNHERTPMNTNILGCSRGSPLADLRATSNPCHPRNPWLTFPTIRVY
jgi:hypothetical protein